MAMDLREKTVSKQLLDSIISSMLNVLLVVDERGEIILANPAAERLLGLGEQKLVGLRIGEVLPDFPNLEPVADPERKSSEVRTSMCGANGELIPVSACVSLMRDHTTGTVIVARDIRAQNLAEAEVRRYREERAHAQQLASLGMVAAVLAHKLNQPLTVIRLLLQQTLRAAKDGQDITTKIHETLSEVELVGATVKEVLRFTRPASRDSRSQVNLSRIAEKIAVALAENAREANLSIDYSGLATLPLIAAVESEWEEIFFILIENSIQAAPVERSAKLTIRGRVQDDTLILEFLDTGSGIAPEHVEKVFELFFSTKSRQQGTGLGLSIARQLVTAHGGEISVESVMGTGSRFLIETPLTNEQEKG